LRPRLLIFFVPLLLLAAILAITQESQGEDNSLDDPALSELLSEFEDGEEALPEWEPPFPPRWFRSNAGGMALEETPSRLAAMRNKYALVIDYLPPDELEPRLLPFFQDGYDVEIRILYEQGKESRKQWLFRDGEGTVRLNAVFKPPVEESDGPVEPDEPVELAEPVEIEEAIEAPQADEMSEELIAAHEDIEDTSDEAEAVEFLAADIEMMPVEEPPVVMSNKDALRSVGFIEIFNEKNQIVEDRWLFEDDSAIQTLYFYNRNVLIKAEAREIAPDSSRTAMYTDTFRYNRSFSLRYVERAYHEDVTEQQPVRLTFPYRVLEAASDSNFLSEKLFVGSDFLGSVSVREGFRMVYETDSRGRILVQTLLGSDDEEVWTLVNTWAGDRIVAALKKEGDDEKLTEYEYDDAGNRVLQRDISNGVLERLVHTEGSKETEELYMNGIVVLKAYWEDGRKIREERVRRR
jgi:hypothetical protein